LTNWLFSQKETSKDSGSPFIQIANALKAVALEEFTKPAQELVLADTDWTFSASLLELREALDSEIGKRKEEHMKRSLDAFKKSLQTSLLEPLSASLGKAEDTMWADIQKTVILAATHADAYAERFRKGEIFFISSRFRAPPHLLSLISRLRVLRIRVRGAEKGH